MANKKLLSCSTEELKEKITRFYFSIGGYFSGCNNIEIIKDDKQNKYILSQSIMEQDYGNIDG